MSRIYIVVVTYNGMLWIEKCLSSIHSSSIKLKTIIIDNGSTDGTIDYIKNNFTNIDLIESKKNLGFGAANNIGIKKAFEEGADYVFLLNQDAWLETNTIEELLKISNQNKDYFILSPLHLEPGKNRLDGNFLNYLARSKENNLLSDFILDNSIKKVYPVEFVNAAAWLITKECYERVGLFDSLFYHYGEDDNYCQRVKYHEGKIGIVPHAKIYHDRDTYLSFNKKFNYQLNIRRMLIKSADINNPRGMLIYYKFIVRHLVMAFIFILKYKKSRYYFLSAMRSLFLFKKLQFSRRVNIL